MDGTGMDHITVRARGNAAGKMLRPLIWYAIMSHASKSTSSDSRRLKKINIFGESDNNRILGNIAREGKGISCEKTVDVVEEFRAVVFQSRAPKHRRTKDTRLSTDAGMVLTQDEFLKALREREQKKARKPAAKRKALKEVHNQLRPSKVPKKHFGE